VYFIPLYNTTLTFASKLVKVEFMLINRWWW